MHGRLTRRNYLTLKEEASALASEVEDITYAWSKNATDYYRLLADILGADEYDEQPESTPMPSPVNQHHTTPPSPMPRSHMSTNGRK